MFFCYFVAIILGIFLAFLISGFIEYKFWGESGFGGFIHPFAEWLNNKKNKL